jgi:hypothetical protein
MITTDNDASATTQFHSVSMETRTIGGGGGVVDTTPYLWDRFTHIHWRAGRNSCTFGIYCGQEFHDPAIPVNEKYVYYYSANGGGKHYGTTTEPIGTEAVNYRGIYALGTTEPLWLYSINVESPKRGNLAFVPATNVLISGCSNVRMASFKREGWSPTFIIHNSTNVIVFGSGAMRNQEHTDTGYGQVTGTSNGILLTGILVQSYDGSTLNQCPLIREDLGTPGSNVLRIYWPENCSIYKRGTVNDAAMF